MNRCSNHRPGLHCPPLGRLAAIQFCLQGSCLTFSLVRLLVDPPSTCALLVLSVSPLPDPQGGWMHTVHSITPSSSLPPASNRSRHSPPSFAFLTYFPPQSLFYCIRAWIFTLSPRLYILDCFSRHNSRQSAPYLNSHRHLPAPVRLLRPLNRGHQCEETLPCHTAEVKLLLHCKLHAPQTGLLDIYLSAIEDDNHRLGSLYWREKGPGIVRLVCAGPPRCSEVFRHALACNHSPAAWSLDSVYQLRILPELFLFSIFLWEPWKAPGTVANPRAPVIPQYITPNTARSASARRCGCA